MELERACVESISEVMEAAAVGVPTPGGGPDKLVLFVVLQPAAKGSKPERGNTEQLKKQCQAAIRERLNPLFRLDKVGIWNLSFPNVPMILFLGPLGQVASVRSHSGRQMLGVPAGRTASSR